MRCSGLRASEREPRSLGVAHAHPYLESPAARVDGERVLAGEQSLQALRPREVRQGFVEPALAEAQHAAGMVEHDLGPRVGCQAERFLRASEMALGFGEAPHPHERHAGHRERAGRHRLAGPAMLLGDRERPLAQLERERQRLTGKRRRDREMREAADLEERPWDPARVAEGVLEVLPGVVGTAGPQLRDAEVDEHECPVIGPHRQLVHLCRGAERCLQAARCFLSPGQIAVPAGELDLEEGQVHVEEAPSLRRSCRRESPSDAQLAGGLVEPAVEDAVDRKRSREVSVAQTGIGREHPEQRVERLAPAGHRQREVVVHQQAPGRHPVTGRLIVADGFDDVALLFVPGGRGAVQRRDRRRRDAPQFEAQQIREQVVVAEPRTGGVERGDEGVLVFEPLEDRLGPHGAGERIGERAADALEDRRAQEQVAHLRWLALQHLGEEIAGHGPLAAGELGHEALRVRVRGQRDRRQAQTGRPSLGAFVQRAKTDIRQRDAAGPEQGAAFVEREAQIGPAQFGQLPREPQAVQAERRLLACREHDPQRWR